MRNIKRNTRGVTLITLVITIMILLVLTSIATYSGIDIIKSSKFTALTTEMKIMQTQVNELYQKYKDGDDNVLNLGEDLATVSVPVQGQAKKVFTEKESGITQQDGYKYFDQNTIKQLSIEGVKQEFFVNVKKRSVVSYQGLKYEGKTYYTLEQIPNGLYNVDYENESSEIPTFNTNMKEISEGKWKVTIENIQYNGNINKWNVKYKLENQENWNTSEELSFIVNQEGNYSIKIVNGNVESEEVTILLDENQESDNEIGI